MYRCDNEGDGTKIFDWFFVVIATYNKRKIRESYDAEPAEPITLGNEGETVGLGGYERANEVDGMRDVLRSRAIAGRGAAR